MVFCGRDRAVVLEGSRYLHVHVVVVGVVSVERGSEARRQKLRFGSQFGHGTAVAASTR